MMSMLCVNATCKLQTVATWSRRRSCVRCGHHRVTVSGTIRTCTPIVDKRVSNVMPILVGVNITKVLNKAFKRLNDIIIFGPVLTN